MSQHDALPSDAGPGPHQRQGRPDTGRFSQHREDKAAKVRQHDDRVPARGMADEMAQGVLDREDLDLLPFARSSSARHQHLPNQGIEIGRAHV